MKKLCVVLILFVISGALFAGGGAEEPTEFPHEKTIRLVIPYGPGGGVDLASRVLAAVAPEYIDQRIDIVSMPGAGGQEAIEFVMNEPADGYTLLVADWGSLVSPALQEELTYTVDDWTMVYQISEVTPIFFTSSDHPVQSVEDWVDALEEEPESLAVAHGRAFGGPHLRLILFEEIAGIQNRHIPTTGGAEAVSFVMAGTADIGASVTSTIASSVEAGELVPLAVITDERHPDFSDTPTLLELGYDVVLPSWYSVMAYQDVPDDIVATIHAAFTEAMQTASAERMARDAGVDRRFRNLDELQAMYNETIENLTTVLTAIGRM